jgi:hypothetical protein
MDGPEKLKGNNITWMRQKTENLFFFSSIFAREREKKKIRNFSPKAPIQPRKRFWIFGSTQMEGRLPVPKRDGSPTKYEQKLARHMSAPRAIDHRDEKDFKSWFKKHWGYWVDTYEPTLGTGIGFPDLQILLPGSILQPIEMKVGEVTGKPGELRIMPREVRPSQVSWHKRYEIAGGHSFALIGFKTGLDKKTKAPQWRAFAVAGGRLSAWRGGYAIGSEAILINGASDQEFASRLVSFCTDFRANHFK